MAAAPYSVYHLIPLSVDPNTLAWEAKFDGRSVAGTPVGNTVALWPDTSGNGRDANFAAGNPVRRNSTTGQAEVDFGSTPGSGMFYGLPVGGIDSSLGLSFYTYYTLDSVPDGSGGAGDGQILFGDDVAHGFRMFASAFIALHNLQVAFQTDGGVIFSGVQAVVGTHSLSVICAPPSDGTGIASLYVDGIAAGSGVWSAKPSTTGLISGNSVNNLWVRGKLAFAGFGRRADSNTTRRGLEAYFRKTWG